LLPDLAVGDHQDCNPVTAAAAKRKSPTWEEAGLKAS
jgi:hypothetical protein